MQVEEGRRTEMQRKTGTRMLKWVLALTAVLILIVFLLVPVFVSSDKGREIILKKINDSLGGETDFANLSMSWWKGIKVADFSFNDSSGQISVAAKQIITKPHYGSILLGSLSLGKTEIFEPKVEINLKGRRAKKVKGSRREVLAGKKHKAITLPIKKIELVVKGGNLKVAERQAGLPNAKKRVRAPAGTVELSQINSRLIIDFPGEYPTGQPEKLLANIRMKGKLGFGQAGYMGLNFGPTEVEIQIRNGLLKIAPFSTKVNNGQLSFAGQADFKQKPTLFKTPKPIHIVKDIEINDQTTRQLLMYLNPVFANAFNVSGAANFNCERLAVPLAGGSKNNIEVIGTIWMDNLRLEASDLLGQILSLAGTSVRGQNITIRPTRFVLQDGFLRYDDMQMDIGDNPVNFKGAIGLDKSLNMTVTLPYTTSGRTARIGKETTGERITLPLKGTIDKPELDFGKLFEEQLKQQLQEKLFESLDKLLK